MSVAEHPIPSRLADTVGGNGRLLATVMGLPLVDGLFPALLLAGVLDTWTGLLQVGLLVFGGSATAVVIISEFSKPFRSHLRQLILIGSGIFVIAIIEAALAPTFASILDLALFKRFAAVVLVTIAAKTASAKIASRLPRTSITIGFGVLASIQPAGATLTFVSEPMLIVRAALAISIAIGFATVILAARPYIVSNVDMGRFRFGSAVALCLVAASVLNLVPESAALIVFVISIVLSYAPGANTSVDRPLAEQTETS